MTEPGRTIPKRERPFCGARCRSGRPCGARVVPLEGGRLARRCRLHGGLSTGARTAEGRERIGAAQRARWARWREARSSESANDNHDQGGEGPAAA